MVMKPSEVVLLPFIVKYGAILYLKGLATLIWRLLLLKYEFRDMNSPWSLLLPQANMIAHTALMWSRQSAPGTYSLFHWNSSFFYNKAVTWSLTPSETPLKSAAELCKVYVADWDVIITTMIIIRTIAIIWFDCWRNVTDSFVLWKRP